MATVLDFNGAVARIQSGEEAHRLAKSLLAQLSEDEKLTLLDGDSPFWEGMNDLYSGKYAKAPYYHGEVQRLHIPGVRYCDGPRGVNINQATVFPVSTARGATWNTALEEQVGRAIGLEARAYGANTVGSVCINLPRHPAWGRVQETYGEDPLLLGEFGAAHVQGLQRNVMACVKHFALNSMELARFRVDVSIDDAALHEVYLPHFERCIEAGALSIMTAYNSINGEWAGENKTLLKDILRDELGFQGFTISDWIFGVRDGVKSIKAGLDIEAPFQNLRAAAAKPALQSQELKWSDIDAIGRRILWSQLVHYATREREEPSVDVVLSQQHRQLARKVATESIVLLKNKLRNGRPLLPLSSDLTSCAVIGRLANSTVTGDCASSLVDCPTVITPYQGIRAALPNALITLSDSDSLTAAVEAARNSEAAILIVGYDGEDEGEYLRPARESHTEAFSIFPPFDESPVAQRIKLSSTTAAENATVESATDNAESKPGVVQHSNLASRPQGGDRSSIRLRTEDVKLIQAVAAVNPRTIVSIVTAGAVIIEEWRNQVPAILIGWYNGCEGGTSLADVLLGTENPSGRLPWSMPRNESHLPDFNPHATRVVYDKWVGQRLLDRNGVTAAYPLGYGLSYTTFSFKDAAIEESGSVNGSRTKQQQLKAIVRVENEGEHNGRCVVQIYGYAQYENETPQQTCFPERVLAGFESIELKAGESRTIEVAISLKPFRKRVGGRFLFNVREISFEISQFANDPDALKLVYKHLRAKF